jgi:hypothetical protein
MLASAARFGPPEEGKNGRIPVMFEPSTTCLACHNGLVSPSGGEMSFGLEWGGSMMANSARDPYWQAAIRRETIDHPEATAAIENECSTCHMPMAHFTASAAGGSAQVFAHLPVLSPHLVADQQAVLAADGVGCTVCHQIAPDKLGTEDSFVGGFVVDAEKPQGSRTIYGPFEVDAGRTRIMHSGSTFVPEQGNHIQESELCASCHTLITHAMNDRHEVVGELPEQVPYLEWLHSDYATSRSCQSCHMPVVSDSAAVTSVLGVPRSNVNRHAFRGGNYMVPKMFAKFGTELGVSASQAELQGAISRTEEHLKSQSAGVRVEGIQVEDHRLTATLLVTNKAGHKLPTAYPSRRVWLHVAVIDNTGKLVFESGALRADGSVVGNDNDRDGSVYEPHYETIRDPSQVQIYEAVMVDPQGDVTTGITSGLYYVKDNRILPAGFDKVSAEERIAVQGVASDDRDFSGSSDRVRVELDGAFGNGPYEVRAELWYQPIGYRWAMALGDYEAMETQRFKRYYRSLSKTSAVMLASDRAVSQGVVPTQ